MKVLHVCNSFDPAGDVTRSVRLLNQFSRHKHKIIVKEAHPLQDKYHFEMPDDWGVYTPQGIKDRFDWCDVTIYHFVGYERGWHEMKKPAAFRNSNMYLNHGTGKSFAAPHYTAADLSRYKLLSASHMAAQDFLPDCWFLPALIPINDPRYMPDYSERAPCFSYAKDSMFFDNMERPGFSLQRFRYRPWYEVLEKRQKYASLVLDNITEGHYGLAGLESLALGLPCIVYTHSVTEHQLADLGGGAPSPFIWTAPHPRAAINKVRESIHYPQERRYECRKWIEKYYNPARLIDRYWDKFIDKLGD